MIWWIFTGYGYHVLLFLATASGVLLKQFVMLSWCLNRSQGTRTPDERNFVMSLFS
jgi:hypothetical protein